MKLRQFLSIMGIVALVALIYSPSTIGFSASPAGDGGTGPNDTSQSGTSMFLSYLRSSGYHVTIANDSQQLTTDLGGQQKLVYLLIGPDLKMSNSDLSLVSKGYQGGRISALIAEGNTTNSDLLQTFGAYTNGAPIIEPTSPFQDRRVFNVYVSLGSASATGLIDIASSLQLFPQYHLSAVALTSPGSTDTRNPTLGQRIVAASGTQSGARALLLTDSAPFTNFLFNYTQPQTAPRPRSSSWASRSGLSWRTP